MLEPLCVPFPHLLYRVFLVHVWQYFYNKVQYTNDNNYGHSNDNNIKLDIIADGLIVFGIIPCFKPVFGSFIILLVGLLRSPVALFDVFDKRGDSIAKGLCDFTNSCTSAGGSVSFPGGGDYE